MAEDPIHTDQKTRYRFGEFLLDAETLWRDSEPVRLQNLPLRILHMLVERSGAIVHRQELKDALWPSGTYVEFDHGLNTAVRKLRLALGDSASSPTYIETIPRRGYRFLLPVRREISSPNDEIVHPASDVRYAAEPAWKALLPVVAGTVLLLALLGNTSQPSVPPGTTDERSARRSGGISWIDPSRPGYRSYQKGMFHQSVHGPKNLRLSIEYYKEAIRAEPENAAYHSSLSDATFSLATQNKGDSEIGFREARAAAEKALALDESMGFAHFIRGISAWLAEWDWTQAEQDFAIALETHGHGTTVLRWHALFLEAKGEFADSLRELQRAQANRPGSWQIEHALGRHFFFARDYERALAICQRLRQARPDDIQAKSCLQDAYRQLGESEMARATALELMKDHGAPETLLENLAALPTDDADHEIHRWWIVNESDASNYHLAVHHIRLGDTDAALTLLERSMDLHESDLIRLPIDPRLDPLRKRPRFRTLLRRMNFPPTRTRTREIASAESLR